MRPEWKAPACYRDWHKLWHEQLAAFGYCAKVYCSFRFDRELAQMIDVARTPQRLWKGHQRLERIEARMEECCLSNDPTYFEHVAACMGMERGR